MGKLKKWNPVQDKHADEDETTVYTADPVWMRKMDRLRKEFSEVIRLKSWTEIRKKIQQWS